jgi:hypothetical protein
VKGKLAISAALWVVGFVLLLAFPAHVPSRDQTEIQGPAFEAEWLKSGDPCLPVKIRKKWLKETYGQDASYLKCIPLLINLSYDLEETYRHHSDYGTDRFIFSCQESFPAHLQLIYDQKKIGVLDSFVMEGPAPCCPGDVELTLTRAESTFLICTHGVGETCKTFSTRDPFDHVVVPSQDPFFGFFWCSPKSLVNRPASGGIGAPAVGLAQGVVPKPYFINSEVWKDETYAVMVEGEEALSWDELKPHVESQESLRLEFPIEVKQEYDYAAPFTETHAVKGKLAVQIEFGEQEKEEWHVTVMGKEEDPEAGVIEYSGQDKKTKILPVNIEFEWLLEGTFWVKKVKKTQTYETGKITAYSQTPSILFGAPDLYRCMLMPCEGRESYKETGKFVNDILFGKIVNQAINLTWPVHPAEACVLCLPKKFSQNNPSYRHQFGSRDFIDAVNKARIPLKDGATVNSTIGDWLAYSITLQKIK